MLVESSKTLSFTSPRGFIVLEGVNGAGKTTLQRYLADIVRSWGLEVTTTREPGATRLGGELRSLLLEKRQDVLSPLAELFLFSADRAEHVEKIVRPALMRREWIICDRYVYSTIAFQGYGRGLSLQTIKSLSHAAVGGLYPDLVILLDLDPQTGLGRKKSISGTSDDEDRFEDGDMAFQNRVAEGFRSVAVEDAGTPFLRIDASQSFDEINEMALSSLRKLFEAWRT